MNDILSSEDKSQINNLIEIDISKNEDNHNNKVMLFDDNSSNSNNYSSSSNLFSETDVESNFESSFESGSQPDLLTINLNNEPLNNNIKFKKFKNIKLKLIKFYNYLKNLCKKKIKN